MTTTVTEKAPNIACIHTSDRIAFKRCRRKWNWGSKLRHYLEMEVSPGPLWLGSGFHYAMEDFHGYNKYKTPQNAFNAYVKAWEKIGKHRMPDDYKELSELMLNMLNYYEGWLSNRRPLKTFVYNGVPQVEVTFEIPLPIEGAYDMEGNLYDAVHYVGTIDKVCIDEHGRLWPLDYKTAKMFSTTHFDTDPQVTAYCVPLDTEILTRRGWKLYSQLIIGEEVLGYNKENDCLEWTKLESVHTPGIFSTVSYFNKSFDFTCTEDHKWVQLGNGRQLKPLQAGKDGIRTLMASKLDAKFLDITSKEAAVIAWLLTDGSMAYDFNICQSKTKYAEEIQQLLNEFPNCYSRISERSNCLVWHLREGFVKSLWKKTGMDFQLNNWEYFVTGLSLEAREAFCNAAMLAEGNKKDFYQNTGTKFDLFRLAFFLCGHFPTRPRECGKGKGFKNSGKCRAFTLGTAVKWNKTIQCKETNILQEVWCPQTGLGTWVMRQGDQITITGNCWACSVLYPGYEIAGFIYQQHLKEIAHPPQLLKTGKLSLNKQQRTTHKLYRDAMINLYGSVDKAPADTVDFLNDLAMQETPDMDRFIRWDYIERSQAQIESEGEKIMLEVCDMVDINLPLYPNPTRDCVWDCSFQAPCLMLDCHDDFEAELENGFIRRGEPSSQWRKFV